MCTASSLLDAPPSWRGSFRRREDLRYYASGRELKDDYEGGKYFSAFEMTLAAIPQSLTGWEN
jgi:hypothetical protein